MESGLIFNQLICEFESRRPCQTPHCVIRIAPALLVRLWTETTFPKFGSQWQLKNSPTLGGGISAESDFTRIQASLQGETQRGVRL